MERSVTDDERRTVDELGADDQRRLVRERYAALASGGDCCGGEDDGCGASADAERLGYDEDDVAAAADAAESSLGCGNPTAIDSLEPGETVLDLGSGAGFDCFLAAREVGPAGSVVGVDMTPEMVDRARENAAESGFGNVEFRLGEIEHLPVADDSVDVAVSNCVINLSPEKPRVFAETRRVLRPGGRLAISDVVRTAPMPEGILADPASVSACVAGAATLDELEAMLADAGFVDVEISPQEGSTEFIREWDDERDPSEYVVSATITARLPA